MSDLLTLNPADLLVDADTNVRADLALDKNFLASIRDHGVLVPVVAVRQADGTLRVRHGHRRTIAAVQAGHDAIPVYVRDDAQSDDEAVADAARIVEQLAENTHRAGLTTTEHVHAVQQLALLGVSAAQIAKRTHARRTQVDAALALTDDDDLHRAEATSLTVAAWCVEFADDDRAVEAIERAYARAGETAAKHEVTRLRKTRAYATAQQAAVAHLAETAPGLVVLTERPGWSGPAAEVDDLDVDPVEHTACPHHAALLVDADSGADSDDEQPAELTIDGVAFTLQPWCLDWQTAGHAHRWRRTDTTPSAVGAPGEDAQAEAREAARAERRRVLAGNRAWDAAAEVRVEWTATLLARRSVPKDAVVAIARAAECAGLRFGHGDAPGLGTTAEATRSLLRLALDTLEAATTRGDWRHPERPSATTATLVDVLTGWGYTPAAVEVAAAGGEAFTIDQE